MREDVFFFLPVVINIMPQMLLIELHFFYVDPRPDYSF